MGNRSNRINNSININNMVQPISKFTKYFNKNVSEIKEYKYVKKIIE